MQRASLGGYDARVRLILASASARRRELLTAAGIAFDVAPSAIHEQLEPGELPEAYVARLALSKARAVHAQHPADVVLGADTVVVVDGAVLEKPASELDARGMLTQLSGRAHDVLTGVAVVSAEGEKGHVERTRVWFAPLSPNDIDWYVDSGEPMDKAGAYAIQGLASRFVLRIEGSYANVVGLPVAQVMQLLAQAGFPPAI